MKPKTINHWETPRWLFNKLNGEFNFKWDLCAEDFNKKVDLHYSPENSCLDNEWDRENWLFINPPYNPLKPFIEKINKEVNYGSRVVAVIPLQTMGNYYFDDSNLSEIRVFKGRLSFEVNGLNEKDANSNARYNTAIFIYDKNNAIKKFSFINLKDFKND